MCMMCGIATCHAFEGIDGLAPAGERNFTGGTANAPFALIELDLIDGNNQPTGETVITKWGDDRFGDIAGLAPQRSAPTQFRRHH